MKEQIFRKQKHEIVSDPKFPKMIQIGQRAPPPPTHTHRKPIKNIGSNTAPGPNLRWGAGTIPSTRGGSVTGGGRSYIAYIISLNRHALAGPYVSHRQQSH